MTDSSNHKSIAIWLFVCCAAVFSIVVLGGVTRLTGSGLSMVDWAPLMGVLPPLDQAQWEEVFERYQQFPEYQVKNFHMGLEEFKGIFWLEYAHRLLGRLIGVIFFFPLLYFIVRGKVDRPLVPKLVAMFILGGLQGLLGWYMVKSGLVRDPRVSQYRLTAHLGLAFVIYAYMFWVALGLLLRGRDVAPSTGARRLRLFTFAVTGLVFLTALSGGFVAGLKAGFAYNTFPFMGDGWIPQGILMLEPAWKNLFENVATVQFNHRLLAELLCIVIPVLWWLARGVDLPGRVRMGFHILLAVMLVQVILGVFTLLMHVPVHLAATHQAGALVLFTVALFVSHEVS